jgi:putative nucleotidyltransferase with HDIG domain
MFGRSSGKIDLPSVPATLARIIQITNSPDASADKVAGVVMLDQSLATKVLRIANSAFYGRRVKAETISEAVVTLGFSSIRNLAASASVVDALFPKQMFPGFSWQDMWVHSVNCAVASEVIHARMTRTAGAEAAFVAGLLHDVGKLILARALPERFRQVVDACRECDLTMAQAERNLLSTDHAKIGGELAEGWQFPDRLRDAIDYHHSPADACENEDIARAVSAANLLAKRMSGNYITGVSVEISLTDVADEAGLQVDDMDFIVNAVGEKMHQCDEILSWSTSMPGAKAAA